MSLYLKPPKGETNLHMLIECVQQRINCFVNIQNNFDIRQIEKFEYLVEDSILDRTGHFLFRLAVLSGSLPRTIFLENEVLLLNQRLKCYDMKDMEHFLKTIIRQLKDCIRSNIDKQLSDFYWTLYNVVSKMLQKDYLSHVFQEHFSSETHCDLSHNKKFCIPIPFFYCNKLISTRAVDLKNGCALFECYQWQNIIPALYQSYLRIVLHEMKFNINVVHTLSDDRVVACLKILNKQYLKNDQPSESRLHLKNLEEASIYFPLCMKNLYDSLKVNHRLGHHDRYDFSLFLKNIGLSLNDSIKFWESEYSKKHSSCSKCSHSWQGNEKKYIYGIRHLYGLEGSRRKYPVRSCDRLQECGIEINCEGGCPFVHYDDNFLRRALKKNMPGSDDDIEVIIYERKESATTSCKLYSECMMKRLNAKILPENVKFENPLQYYNLMKNKRSDTK